MSTGAVTAPVLPAAAPRGRGRAARLALELPAAALAAAALAVLAAALAGTTPRVELSDSMRPAIAAGDVVWLERIPARDARAGDVVAFAEPGGARTLLHRVRRVRRMPGGALSFVTRGDANGSSESWRVAASGVLGRYTGVRLPAVGRGLAALAGLPPAVLAALGALLAALGLRSIWRG